MQETSNADIKTGADYSSGHAIHAIGALVGPEDDTNKFLTEIATIARAGTRIMGESAIAYYIDSRKMQDVRSEAKEKVKEQKKNDSI